MFPLTIRMRIQTLFIVFLISFTYGEERRIISKLNPNCGSCSSRDTLIYIQAIGEKDTIHQIWDFTLGMPTVIFAVGSVNSSLTIKWEGSHPLNFNFSESPQYSFGATIDSIYEYSDLNDNGFIDNKCPKNAYSLRDLAWELKDSTMTDKEVMIHMYSDKCVDEYAERLGIVEIKLDLLPFKDYASDLPHLIHTANSTLFDVSLVNISTSTEYNNTRYALHFTLVSNDGANDTMHFGMRKSLDDEHTPGVFEIMEIKTPATYRKSDGGYIQFRPVAYTQRERSIGSSTVTHVTNFNSTSLPSLSTIERFYGTWNKSQLLVQDMFMSFGETGDGFYRASNFTAWSFTMGYGTPPMEGFSLLVIMIISIGLGVPVLLATSGVAYVLVRRCRAQQHARFTDDQ